jgi:hypothetical protein
MRRSSLGSALIGLAVAALAGGSVALAQDPDAVAIGRGPQFLLASARPSERPLAVDVASVPVLRRRLSLDLEDAGRGEALDAISKASGLRLVYANGVSLGEGRVRLKADQITVAAALTEVLLDAGVDVLLARSGDAVLVKRIALQALAVGSIVGRVTDAKTQTALGGATVVVEGTRHSATTGNDGRYHIAPLAPGQYTVRARYIGYSPGSASVTVGADQEATADFSLEKSVQRLDEVVTTGTVVPTEVKALPTPISVITADDIQRQNLQRVDQVFRGEVPGAIAWDQGPLDYYSTVSVRGASTLGSSPSVKTFIDGVEVADPSSIATIDPNSVDRIEVTRGPQASTLYGAGALSGVMQIFTKKGRLGLTRPEVAAKLSAGGIGGFEGQSTAFQTDNALSLSGGGEKTSYNLGGSYRHLGEWLPVYNSTDWGVSTGGQTTQGPFTLSGSARYADKRLDWPWDTRFQAYTVYSKPFYQTDRLQQQTYGVTASLQATRTWQHTLTLGYDQTYFAYNQTQPRFTMPADSFLIVLANHQAKSSLLYHITPI